MRRTCPAPALLSALVAAGPAIAQAVAAEPVDAAAIAFFRAEGLERSQVMDHLSWLCDVYGPRLTGSPNLRRAQQFAVERLAGMGYAARTESWGPFGRGWRCDHVALAVVGDNPWPVIAYAKAWSPGVDGRIDADVVHVAGLAAAELEALEIEGKVVLIEPERAVTEPFDALSTRLDDAALDRLAASAAVDTRSAAERGTAAARDNDFRTGFQRRQQMLQIVQRKRPLCIVDRGSKGDYGTVFVAGASAADRQGARQAGADVVPQLTIAVEHYNRMVRLLQKGLPVRVALELRTTFFDDDPLEYNVVADLVGGDGERREQCAMLGAHLDSWHSGTGATDNGCGSAVVIEAARLIGAWCEHSGRRPRRTVRACLWSGEEQGLLGSRAFVEQHLGTREVPKPGHGLVAGYFNLDNGTGRIRGVYLQGNEAVRPIFRAWLEPFRDLGAATLTIEDTGGTDHLSFHRIGVPGFQFVQDPVSYGTRTHHSNMDVFDHAVADDLAQAAVIMATFVWHTAERDELLPRPEAR